MKWLPALIWLGLILYFSLTPQENFPHPKFPGSDKVFHMFSYGILQALAYYPVKHKLTANFWTVLFLFIILIGVLVEFLQAAMVLGRTGEFGDILFNVFGALIVYFYFLSKWRGKEK